MKPLRYLYKVECDCDCELARHVEVIAGDPEEHEVGDREEIDCPECSCSEGEVTDTQFV